MATQRIFPGRISLRRPQLSPADIVVGLGVIALLYGVLRLGRSMTVRFTPSVASLPLPTGISHIPYYAARSLLRMFIALGASTVFTFLYGTAAARLRRAEKVLVPLLDILQSVPILGFLTFTVTFFVNAFKGSLLGLEAASVFAVFTSQAWNMTFSFYHSLVSQPRDLDEASRMYRLTKWQRFWKLDVPGSMIGLVWNAMMSMGGGWFFLTASEAISINGKATTYLPGIGSYIGVAEQQGSIGKVGIAIAAMVVLVIGVNVLFFRPLVAWAEKFRMEESEAGGKPRSYVLDLLRQSRLPKTLGRRLAPLGEALGNAARPFGLAEYPLAEDERKRRAGDAVFWAIVVGVCGWGAWAGMSFLVRRVGWGTFAYAFGLGGITFARVAVVVLLSTLIWVPIGVKIGMSPHLSRYAQPVVQVLASFPSNLLFPFAVIAFLAIGLSLNIGGVVLMALGAQWYILFNAIAGGMAVPNDLREMSLSMRLTRAQRWRRVILPAVFPAYVTGGVTAAGGAWNASIVAEVATWRNHHLVAKGLGAFITNAANSPAHNAFAKVLTGVVVMSFYVVVVNRVFWRRLYRLAEARFTL
ncbi:MAG TPA: ABC transporter permease subunit [Acidimicrobiales bacterium]|nr:ABC transporter permease subunit [Acidimicrobiales bacterium]